MDVQINVLKELYISAGSQNAYCLCETFEIVIAVIMKM
jgi:hypothetical protein